MPVDRKEAETEEEPQDHITPRFFLGFVWNTHGCIADETEEKNLGFVCNTHDVMQTKPKRKKRLNKKEG